MQTMLLPFVVTAVSNIVDPDVEVQYSAKELSSCEGRPVRLLHHGAASLKSRSHPVLAPWHCQRTRPEREGGAENEILASEFLVDAETRQISREPRLLALPSSRGVRRG